MPDPATSPPVECRLLVPGDEPALEAFLGRHADSSTILRSNAARGGLVDCGETYQGTYAGRFEGGTMAGAAAHYWNGNLVLQAPVGAGAVARLAAGDSGRAVAGLLGPWEQVTAARGALGLAAAETSVAERDVLFALDLAELIVPAALTEGRLVCRRSRDSELDVLIEWRIAFAAESLNRTAGPEARRSAREAIERSHAEGLLWVLDAGPGIVSTSVFIASLPERVQVGGVWTPPAQRGKGYARAVVAGSLAAARESGARRAVLFAHDPFAIRAYEAIGFRPVGDYGIILFRQPQTLRGE